MIIISASWCAPCKQEIPQVEEIYTYWAKDNLRLNANILLYQPSISSFDNQGGLSNDLKVAFDAGLVYKPTKNSFLEIRIKNLPNYGLNNRLNNNLTGRRILDGYGFGIY